MPVNPNEAPEGFVAKDADELGIHCTGCFFDEEVCQQGFSCHAGNREDGCFVIFVPLTNKAATANWPHDDMGTPV